METASMKISPDGHDVAIRNRTNPNSPRYAWRVSTGRFCTDEHVAAWLDLVVASPLPEQMTEADKEYGMETSPIKISPDGHNVAIRNRKSPRYPWRVTTGGYYTDEQVAAWIELAVAAPPPEQMTEDDAVAALLALLNSTIAHPGSAWYADRPEIPFGAQNRGRLDCLHFERLTDDLARKQGLLDE